MFIDFYELLEISPNATQEEIKSTYRKQCIKWHPDKNLNEDTTDRMQSITQAYLILKDIEARARYDAEYQKFKSSNQDRVFNQNTSSYNYPNYDFEDEILKKWMSNAKKQVEEMAKESIDEFVGASKEAGSSIGNYVVKTLLPMFIIFVLVKACLN